jgi:EamA domain-containing membrane protein RarD
MTLQDIFNQIGQNPNAIIGFFVGLPIFTFVALQFSKEESYDNPWRYMYSGIVYLACIPGISAIVLTIYTAIFQRQSLLNVNFFVYFLPIISMIITLLILRSRLDLRRIPGFKQVSGFLMIIAAVVITMLILDKMRILVLFYGNIWFLVGVFVVLFVVFKIGWERITR